MQLVIVALLGAVTVHPFLFGKPTIHCKRDHGNIHNFAHPRPSITFPPTDDRPSRGLILIDSFSPYFNNYISYKARNVWGVGVVECLSPYVCEYLRRERGEGEFMDDRAPYFPPRSQILPADNGQRDGDDDCDLIICDDCVADSNLFTCEQLQEYYSWISDIPFSIAGVISESDSGLVTAENLVEASCGSIPGDGALDCRRDKFLLNEALADSGIGIVIQKRCFKVEEAVYFALEDLEMGDENVVVVKPVRGGEWSERINE